LFSQKQEGEADVTRAPLTSRQVAILNQQIKYCHTGYKLKGRAVPDNEQELAIEVKPEKVFNAITRQDELIYY
jgi:hypothetical protein